MGPGNPQRRFGSCCIATRKHISPLSESILLLLLDKLFSKATHLTPVNLVNLLKCSLEGQRTYAVDTWKLLFQKASPALDQALVTFTTMVGPCPDCTKALMSRVDSLYDLMLFPIVGPQQQQPILVECSWGSRRGDNCQLQPGGAAEWCLCPQLVPDKDETLFGLVIPQLPILPFHQELQLPNVSDCVSKYVICFLTVTQTAAAAAFLPAALMLKASFQIPASRHSAAKRHSWTEKDSKQSSRISSDHISPEMSHQVKPGALAQFVKEWIA